MNADHVLEKGIEGLAQKQEELLSKLEVKAVRLTLKARHIDSHMTAIGKVEARANESTIQRFKDEVSAMKQKLSHVQGMMVAANVYGVDRLAKPRPRLRMLFSTLVQSA